MAEKCFIKCPNCSMVFGIILSGHGEHARRCPHCHRLLMIKNRWPRKKARPGRISAYLKRLWASLTRLLSPSTKSIPSTKSMTGMTDKEQISDALAGR